VLKYVQVCYSLISEETSGREFGAYVSNASYPINIFDFYVNKEQLNQKDEYIGKVVACPWYNPIRALRLPGQLESCLEQYGGDGGVFQTEIDLEYSMWYEKIYYFF